MGQRTPLYEQHLALGAKMVDFSGWDMPLHYGSQVEEHHQVRHDCGVFDVSHMTVTEVTGPDALAFLQRVLSRDPTPLAVGQGLHALLLNEQGGVIDDVSLYRTEQGFRLVSNARTRERVARWLQQHRGEFDVQCNVNAGLGLLAIQGPNALERTKSLVNKACADLISRLEPGEGLEGGDWFISRSGYTGEDGLEIALPLEQVGDLFNELIGAGISPIGLGARDTLRLEAGLNLCGQDMSEDVSPLSSNSAELIDWEPVARQFIGREAVAALRALPQPRLVGLVLEERGVLRAGQVVRVTGIGDGAITSGSFSPTLGKSIALARLPAATQERAEVEIRGKWYPVRVVKPTFVRHGKVLV